MLKCLHVVITMAFIYPVLASTHPTLMAIAKQYSAVKQGSIYYGWCGAELEVATAQSEFGMRVCRSRPDDLCLRRGPSNADGIDESRGHVGHHGHPNRRPLPVGALACALLPVIHPRAGLPVCAPAGC